MSMFMTSVSSGMNATWRQPNLDYNIPAQNRSRWWGQDTTDPWDDGVIWPNSGFQGAAQPYLESTHWGPPPREHGGQSMKKFQGITQDSTGTALGGVHVDLFLTTGDVFLRDVTSDAGGYFDIGSEYAGQNHFIYAAKTGSPNLGGVTVENIQPT